MGPRRGQQHTALADVEGDDEGEGAVTDILVFNALDLAGTGGLGRIACTPVISSLEMTISPCLTSSGCGLIEGVDGGTFVLKVLAFLRVEPVAAQVGANGGFF